MLNLTQGAKLSLTLPAPQDGGEPVKLHCLFESEGDFITVTPPCLNGTPYPLQAGQRCTLGFTTPVAFCSCECLAVRKTAQGKEEFYQLSPVGEIKRVQRRQDFRLRITLPCSVRRTASAERSRAMNAHTIDISGGGAALYIGQPFESGEALVFTVRIGEFGTLTIPGRVLWSRPHEGGGDNLARAAQYVCGVVFDFKRDNDKEALVRYVLLQQLKKRHERQLIDGVE